jgi:hypothetical protein
MPALPYGVSDSCVRPNLSCSTDPIENAGLIMQALSVHRTGPLKRLTTTCVTLGLSDIPRAVNVESEDEVWELVLSMVGVSPS